MGHNFSVKAPALPQFSSTLGGASAITEVSYSLKLLVFFDSAQHFFSPPPADELWSWIWHDMTFKTENKPSFPKFPPAVTVIWQRKTVYNTKQHRYCQYYQWGTLFNLNFQSWNDKQFDIKSTRVSLLWLYREIYNCTVSNLKETYYAHFQVNIFILGYY